MELRRKQFVIVITFLAVIGAAFTATPFILSMNPTDDILNYAKELEISEIRPNSSSLFHIRKSKKIARPSSTTWQPGVSLFVIRDDSSKYYLYKLPTWEGKIIMPFKHWGQHEGYCLDLGISIDVKNEITIKCGSPNYSEFLTKQWYWTMNGVNLGEDLPDLIKVKFRVSDDVMYAFMR